MLLQGNLFTPPTPFPCSLCPHITSVASKVLTASLTPQAVAIRIQDVGTGKSSTSRLQASSDL